MSSRVEASDPRWLLVRRVAASAVMARSHRLQAMLLFICEKALADGAAATERDVALSVYGRGPEFDPTEDTIVRVQTSQLRRKLQLYFATEGAHEPMTLELGRGTYWPAFRERPLAATREPPKAEATAGRGRSRTLVALSTALAASLLACLWLVLQNRALETRLAPGGAQPNVDRLWRQLVGNGQDTVVVLGDSGLPQIQDLLGHQLTVNQYQRGLMSALHEDQLGAASFALAKKLARQRYTALADVGLATEAVRLCAAHGVRAEVLLAPDAEPQLFRGHNVILAGTRRSNPWVELFEDRMSFRGHYDLEEHQFQFDNVRPQTGEPLAYAVEWGRVGYCRVAYRASLDGRGHVLLVTGGDMSSGAAGATFVTSEPWLTRLRERLHLGPRDPFPHFEALLRVELVASAASQFELVAHRVAGR